MADSQVRNRVTDLLGSVMTILMRTCSSLQYWLELRSTSLAPPFDGVAGPARATNTCKASDQAAFSCGYPHR